MIIIGQGGVNGEEFIKIVHKIKRVHRETQFIVTCNLLNEYFGNILVLVNSIPLRTSQLQYRSPLFQCGLFAETKHDHFILFLLRPPSNR